MGLFRWTWTAQIRLDQVKRIQAQTAASKRAELALTRLAREVLESQGIRTAAPVSLLQQAIASGRRTTTYLRDGKLYEAQKMRAFMPLPVQR
jgi:hypothetical protein